MVLQTASQPGLLEINLLLGATAASLAMHCIWQGPQLLLLCCTQQVDMKARGGMLEYCWHTLHVCKVRALARMPITLCSLPRHMQQGFNQGLNLLHHSQGEWPSAMALSKDFFCASFLAESIFMNSQMVRP
jgi:hypothetical protein